MIDADAIINELKKNRCADCDRRKGIKQGKMTFVYDFGEAPCRACDVGDTIDILDEAPTIGGWINNYEWICPTCGTSILVKTSKQSKAISMKLSVCPGCGKEILYGKAD